MTALRRPPVLPRKRSRARRRHSLGAVLLVRRHLATSPRARAVGWGVALAVLLGSWSGLAWTNLPTPALPPAAEDLPLTIVLEEQAPPPEPEPEPVTPEEDLQPLIAEEAAATYAALDPEPGETDGGPAPAAADFPVLEVPGRSATLESWAPSEAQTLAIANHRLDAMDSQARLEGERMELQRRIARREVESAGKEFLLNSDGGMEGVIRTGNFDAVDDDSRARRVLESRYGITIESRYVSVNPKAGRSYLNAAVTKEGTYTAMQAEGYYEVFSLSAKAVSMMAAMEVEELRKRNLDPTRTRLRRVEFSLVPMEGDYALVITGFETENIR